jgi:exonuclease III
VAPAKTVAPARAKTAGATKTLRFVAYNFLVGGSAKRGGHWSRLLRTLAPDVVFGQECRPPDESHGERYRPEGDDAFLWRAAGDARRWGAGLLLRNTEIDPIDVPQYGGWVVGGEVRSARWSTRPVRLFSVHTPAGESGYVRTMHEILDRMARLRHGADLVLGGDFNVAVGYRTPPDPHAFRRSRRDLLDRLATEFDLMSCWQAAHPNRRLAQTLRWSTNPTTPYHCDGIFVPRAWRSRLAACRVVRGARWNALSDHNPVLAEFEAMPSAPPLPSV